MTTGLVLSILKLTISLLWTTRKLMYNMMSITQQTTALTSQSSIKIYLTHYKYKTIKTYIQTKKYCKHHTGDIGFKTIILACFILHKGICDAAENWTIYNWSQWCKTKLLPLPWHQHTSMKIQNILSSEQICYMLHYSQRDYYVTI